MTLQTHPQPGALLIRHLEEFVGLCIGVDVRKCVWHCLFLGAHGKHRVRLRLLGLYTRCNVIASVVRTLYGRELG